METLIPLPLPPVRRLAPTVSPELACCEGTCYRAESRELLLKSDLRPIDGRLMCPTCRGPYRCDGECRDLVPFALTTPRYGARYCHPCATQATVDEDAGEWTPEDGPDPEQESRHSHETGIGGRCD